MSVSSIEVRKCDHCGDTHEMRREGSSYDWCKLVARQVNGPFRIGDMAKGHDERSQADLCPDCMRSLSKWWDAGKDKDDTP